jgi:recyclin-1
MTGGSAAVQGIAMLNPARWGASEPANRVGEYKKDFGQGESLFDADEKANGHANGSAHRNSTTTLASSHSNAPSISRSHSTSDSITLNEKEASTTQLDLLLSLDVALELIHEDRKALKRVEIFQGYPGHYGHRVKDTIEELFILFLCVLVDGHVSRGFGRCVLSSLFRGHT